MSDAIMTDATRAIVREATAEAVQEVFKTLGIDIEQAEEIRHFQANMAWVFRFRRLSERVGATIILTVVTTLTGGVLALLWDGLSGKGGH